MDTDHEVNRTRHQMNVPGLGVLIAPKVVGFSPYTITGDARGLSRNRGLRGCCIRF